MSLLVGEVTLALYPMRLHADDELQQASLAGQVVLYRLLSFLLQYSYPNIPPKNEPEDLTFLSASAMSWIASFSFPELSIFFV